MGTKQERKLSQLARCMTNRPRREPSGQERVFSVAAHRHEANARLSLPPALAACLVFVREWRANLHMQVLS